MTDTIERIRVLHLDDEPTVLTATENYFGRFEDDITFETTTDPAAALDRLAGGAFDCLLSDYEMPRMNGLVVLSRVQASDEVDVPVVMYTGKGSEDIASEAISKGAAEYVPKGDGMDHYADLADDIRTAVEKHGSAEAPTATRGAASPTTSDESPSATGDEESTPPQDDLSGLLSVTEDGDITHVDEQAAALLDSSRDTLLGSALSDVLPAAAVDRVTERCETTRSAETPVGFELPRAGLRGVAHPGDGRTTIQLAADPSEGTATENLVDSLPDVWYALDTEGQFIRWNDAFETATGYSHGELDECDPVDLLPDAECDHVRTAIQRVVDDQETVRIESAFERKNGEQVPYEFTGAPLRDGDGEVVGVTGVGRDVSERRARKRELEDERAFTQSLIDAIPDAFHAFDTAGNIIEWNERATTVTGYSPEEFGALHASDLVPDRDAERVSETIETIIEEETEGEVESHYLTKDGREIPYEFTGGPLYDADGNVVGLAGIGRDITKFRQRERELEEERAFTQSLIDAIPDIFYAFDEDGNYYRWNDRLLEVSGYTDEEMAEKQPWELIPDYDRERITETIQRIVETGESVRVESQFLTEAGRKVPYEYTGAPVRDAGGDIVGIVGIGRDITEQKARSERLRETKQRLDLALAATDTGVWEWNTDTDAVFWNDSTHRLFGVDPGEFDDSFEAFAERVHPDDFPEIRAALDEALEDGAEYNVEYRIQRVDGDTRWMSDRGELVTDDDGTERMLGTVTDITERKQQERELGERERKLEETKQRLDLALEATDTGVWEWNTDTDAVFWNDSTHRLFGVDPGEFEGTMEAYAGYVHPADISKIRDALDRTLENGVPYEVEHRMQRPDGAVRWMLSRGELVTDDDGTERMLGTVTDITERKQRERELRERERKLEQISENVDDVVWMKTPDLEHMEFISDSYEDVWGRAGEELTNDPQAFIEAVHSEDRERVRDAMDVQRERPDEYEETYRVVQPDGEVRWVRDRSSGVYDDDGTLQRIVGIASDITERKEHQQKLEATRQQLDIALDETETGVWSFDLETETVTPYGKTTELFGVGSDETDIGVYFGNIHAEDRPAVERAIEDAIERRGRYEAEFRVEVEDTVRWLRGKGQITTDERGTPSQMIGVTTDITARKERERELQRNRDLLKQTQELADIGGWELDVTGEPPYDGTLTDELKRIHGVELGDSFDLERGLDFYHPDDRPRVREAVDRALADGDTYDIEARLRTADGEQRWVRSTSVPVFEDGEVVRLRGAMQDITDRKERERELERQNERLELLASTISHDLRNPLRSARTNLKMAQQEVESALLDDIAFAHERIEELISDLLTLARQGRAVTDTESVDLATTAREVWDGIDTEDATLDTEAVIIDADRTRLRQVFENLFVNAISHGRPDVHVRVGPTERGFVLEDDGPGVPADEREDVFEYGYSTADTGTGFGLAIVEEIAEAHGWRVTLTESEDGGARFEFET